MSDFDTPAPGAPDVAAPAATTNALDTTVVAPPGDDLTPTPISPAKKKRRRGSRGGRNRKKRPAGGSDAGGPEPNVDEHNVDEPNVDESRAPERAPAHDWTDARADRGLTADDLAATARDEAGLDRPDPPLSHTGSIPPPPPRPRIGDTRPAPARAAGGEEGSAEGVPKKKRRRRGGRGRGKGGGETRPATQLVGGARHATGYIEGGLDLDDDGTSILDQLDEATLERRRGLTRKGRPTGRYLMVVHVEPSGRGQIPAGRSQIAVLEGRTLVEHYVAEPADDVWQIDGNVYLGKVQNVLPGMEAAFVDIGTPKNGVLYRGDVAYDAAEIEGNGRPKIEQVLRNGQSIVVQVTKNPIAHKGARLTQEVSLAGRFVVMVPGQPGTYGISKRLPDDERRRLRRVLDRVRPSDAGLIVRTAAEGATEEELERDLRRLKAQWDQIDSLAKRAKPGSLLYKEPPLAIRVIREEFTKEYRGIVIDDRALYEEVRGYIEAVSPELAERVEYYDPDTEPLGILERFHVLEQLHKALDPKVWLPSGGSIVIEHTEALTVIDVNTGKNVGRSNLEETVFRNNLEAANVVARELRLRDIGGIIVIDFIDMETRANREAVEAAFREALARDKTRTQVFPISELGLLEMTRKRVSEGLVESFSETCPTCEGKGFLLDRSLLE
jgi:ribonuclease E